MEDDFTKQLMLSLANDAQAMQSLGIPDSIQITEENWESVYEQYIQPNVNYKVISEIFYGIPFTSENGRMIVSDTFKHYFIQDTESLPKPLLYQIVLKASDYQYDLDEVQDNGLDPLDIQTIQEIFLQNPDNSFLNEEELGRLYEVISHDYMENVTHEYFLQTYYPNVETFPEIPVIENPISESQAPTFIMITPYEFEANASRRLWRQFNWEVLKGTIEAAGGKVLEIKGEGREGSPREVFVRDPVLPIAHQKTVYVPKNVREMLRSEQDQVLEKFLEDC